MTLLELTVALSLFSLAVGGIYAFIVTGGRSARVTNNFVQAQTQMRAALDSVIDEARWAQRLVAAGPTSVTLLIRCDPRLSPPAPCGPYTVTFAYNAAGATLTRQVDPDAAGPLPAGPAAPLAYRILREDGTAGFAIEYFDGTGASLGASPADLTLVTRLRLTVDATDGIVSRTFAGDVALRER
jgi:type II secretory pathway pseudopilin PulG